MAVVHPRAQAWLTDPTVHREGAGLGPKNLIPQRVWHSERGLLSTGRTGSPAGVKLGPNERCWCGSGRKYKKCHRDADKASNPDLQRFSRELRAPFAQAQCMHPDAPSGCSPSPSKAHTISRAAALSPIAEKGHVVTLLPDLFGVVRERPGLDARTIGINDASTFLGFCGAHDSQLFAPIDQQFSPSRHTALLLHYRALCMELHKKRAMISVFKAFVARVRGDASKYDQQVGATAYREATRWTQEGIADMEAEKAELDALVARGDYSGMRFVALEFDRFLPIASCGAFAPEWDLDGSPLQDIASTKPGEMAMASLNVLPNGSRGIAMLAWLGDRRPCAALARSMSRLSADDPADLITRLAFQAVENTFISPHWWRQLGNDQQADLMLRARSPQQYEEFARPGTSLPLGCKLISRTTDIEP